MAKQKKGGAAKADRSPAASDALPGALRSRIVSHTDVPPDTLITNPLNFRLHPDRQRAALRGSLQELGWLKEAALVNQRTGHILDGHARIEEALRQGLPTVPVTFVDLSEEEERLALAVLDPISELAERNEDALQTLLGQVNAGDSGLAAMLEGMRVKTPGDGASGDGEGEVFPPEQYQVLVTCKGEDDQAKLLERLHGEGYSCCSLIQ